MDSVVSRLKRENAEMAQKLNDSLRKNNKLSKKLEKLKKDHGELLLINNETQHQLPKSRIECEDEESHEFGAQIRVLSSEVKALKKQNGDLKLKIKDLGTKKMKIEEELVNCRLQCENLKEIFTMLEAKTADNSRISMKNDKLERKLNSVLAASNERFRSFEKRILELEKVAAISSRSGPQLVDTRHTNQVMHEQENHELEEERERLVGAQSGFETIPNKEKMASSIPIQKRTSATRVRVHLGSIGSDTRPARHVQTPSSEENSASSTPYVHKSPSASPFVAEISSSGDDSELPSPKGHKRKLPSSDVSSKEDGGGSKSNSSKERTVSGQALGLDELAQQSVGHNKIRVAKGKEKVTNSSEHDQDYIPDDDHDSDDGSFDGYREPEVFTEVAVCPTPKSVPKKKAKVTDHEFRKKKKHTLCPSSAMDDYMMMQEQVDTTEAHQYSGIDRLGNQENTTLSENQGHTKKGRGPSKLTNVYARKWEDRVVIRCNDEGKPIGPRRSELTRFLGTIAHDHKWAPLTYISWQKLPNKDKIWEFVNSKYILPEIAKGWVMEKLDSSWRVFKCRIKKNHYYKYDSYEERMKHLPKRVPESHFKALLAYWDTNAAKKTSLQNSRNRQEQDSMRKASPVTPVPLAVENNQMSQGDGVAPSKRRMLKKTRSQKQGKSNEQSDDDDDDDDDDDGDDDDTLKNTQAMERLEASQVDHGRVTRFGGGVYRKKIKEKGTDTSLIIPKEVMDSIKSAITADVENDTSSKDEELVKEKQSHAAQDTETERGSEELDCQASKLQDMDMQKKFDTHEETMTLDAVALALAHLRRKDPSLTPEMIANVIASTATNGA